MAPTKDPAGLKTSGRKLWRSVVADFDLEAYEHLLLLQACRTADRLDDLADESAKDGATVLNSKGDRVPHPANVESRQQSIVLSRLLASLRLPTGETEAGDLIRPQRRGSARGSYGLRSVS